MLSSRLLADPEWQQWSDREIARHCQVSNRYVSLLRKDLSVYGTQITGRKTRRRGTVYETKIRVASIEPRQANGNPLNRLTK